MNMQADLSGNDTRPTLQARWLGVSDAWSAYKNGEGDALMHTLISLDSFMSHASEHSQIVECGKEAISLLEALADNAGSLPSADLEALLSRIQEFVNAAPATYSERANVRKPRESQRAPWVVLYWPNAEEASDIAAQMEHYGYSILIQPTLSKAVHSAITKSAVMLVIDVSVAPPAHLQEPITHLNAAGVQWLAVSDKGSFEERLSLVRLRATDVMQKPVTASLLVDAIDRNSRLGIDEPYRVMVVDSSPDVQTYVRQVLQTIDVQHMAVTHVASVLDAMNEFSPDLILMDLRLENCSGVEVAQIIRQHEQFVSIPIVYMSDETNRQVQIEAIRMGGDEFLVKPVHAEYLLAIVVSKIKRYRSLRKFMVQDSLTGLLNHTRIKQHLAQALLLARRDKQSLAFAMLDIDHFKTVNDSYGHPVGDRVIKSLAKMLQQRVRKSDVVGRYGGEEFAVVLYGATQSAAFTVMDRIRKDFSTVYHPYDNGIFAATFSCGIAGYPGNEDATSMAAQADVALYEAKHGGRNRVVVHGAVKD
jgi:two-component system cell cycle response regulator